MPGALPVPALLARALLSESDEGNPPVDLEAIVSQLPGLRLVKESLDGPGYLVDLGRFGTEILVRETDPFPRQRFTIAHELGHWTLQTKGVRNNHGHDAIVEKWCDTFAAELLMPASWLVRELRCRDPLDLLMALIDSPHKYGVSHEAFRLRVPEVTPLSVFEVQALQGGLKLQREYLSPQTRVSFTSIREILAPSLIASARTDSPGCIPIPGFNFSAIYGRLPGGVPQTWLICLAPREWLQQVASGDAEESA
jgi:Zn-dependent peptidase ImmA (M78 family)